MPYAEKLSSNVILTVGCASNLLCSGRSAEILAATRVGIFISEVVYQSDYTIYMDVNGQRTGFSLRGWFDDLVVGNVLKIANFENDAEANEFCRLACNYGPPKQDGRASVATLAKQRNWLVGCDDLSTMKMLDRQQPPGFFVCAIDFVKVWAEERRVGPDEIGRILIDMQSQGAYTPYQSHPSYEWWLGHIRSQTQRDT